MKSELYTGCVEDRNDPLFLGRCKVRIVGLHTESKVSLPTDDLPWAYPVQPITSAGVSGVGTAPLGPVEGTWVLITFMDKDQQMPIMLGTLAGAYQTPDSLLTGNFTIDIADPSGEVVTSTAPGLPPIQQAEQSSTDGGTFGGAVSVKDGKVVTDPSKIVGPLGTLIAKAESGSAGYNAFNRGTANGRIIPAGGTLELTKMPIKQIMALQALPPGDPNRLFAVGKYQCIPTTLKAACQALNIDVNEPFSERTQDIICQEYLVGLKRPALIAYYRNPDRNNQQLLFKAGQSLAAEFASIEDPYFPGYPYKGPNGSYYRSGNRAKTLWERDIKPTLQREWDFRNNKESPPPTASIADNDKVAKGTDYSGVAISTPVDDSVGTPPVSSTATSSTAPPVNPNNPVIPDNPIDGQFSSSFSDQLSGVASDVNSSIQSVQQGVSGAIDQVAGSFGQMFQDASSAISGIVSGASSAIDRTLNASIDSFGSALSGIGSDALSALKSLGGNIDQIASNLGIENVSGTLKELGSNLGLYNASPEDVVKELAKKAGTVQGQAAALLAKLESEGEPTKNAVAEIGERNADGSISNGTGVDPTVGFQDPNGSYPRYRNEPDTNRLATGSNLGRTIVLKKEAALKTGVKIANGGSWDQAPVPYNAAYPYNKVMSTESGHVQEWDDTPGSERIHVYHKSGTFSEIDSTGTRVNRIVGDGYEIYERNGFIYVKGGYSITVDGSLNLRTDNVLNLEVSGATNINVYNEANINVSKDCNLAVGASLNAKANTINLESERQFNIRAGTGLNVYAGKDINFKSDSSIFINSLANVNVLSRGSIFNQSEGDIHNKAAGIYNVDAGKDINILSAAAMKIKSTAKLSVSSDSDIAMDAGGIIDMANGSSEAPSSSPNASPAKDAKFAEIELPVETRGTSGIDRLPQVKAPSRGSEVGFDAPVDQGSSSDPDYIGYQNNRISNNEVSKTSVESTAYEKYSEVPNSSSASSPGQVAGLDMIYNMSPDQFTAGMKLSKYFTLGDLTKGGVRIPRVTYRDKRGNTYTPQQIVANLKNLAVNVLDPIREECGPFTITSAFRRPPHAGRPGDLGVYRSGARAGQPIQEGGDHPAGCAADIVFPGGKQVTYDNAKKIASILKSWNQIIMEYNGSSYWIHVACKPENNKGDMFTMVNHKTYSGTHPRGGFVLV